MSRTFGDRTRATQPRSSNEHTDLAASVQLVLEENYFALLNFVHKQTGATAVCLAGGVALNCVANGMIFERTPFGTSTSSQQRTTLAPRLAPRSTYSIRVWG